MTDNTAQPSIIIVGSDQLQPAPGAVLAELNGRPNPTSIYIQNLAPRSRRVIQHHLRRIVGLFAGRPVEDISVDDIESFLWWRLRFEHTQAVRAWLVDHAGLSLAGRTMVALRGVLKVSKQLKLMSSDDYDSAIALKSIRGYRLPPTRRVSQAELVAMFEICTADQSVKGARDAAMIAVMYGCGLRREETANLRLPDDLSLADEALTVRAGKGNKDRIVPMQPGSIAAVEDWLNVRGTYPGALFCRLLKSGKIVVDAAGNPLSMTPDAVWQHVDARAKAAGLEHLSPHDLRGSMASDFLDATGDIFRLQRFLGHALVETTVRYDRRGSAEDKEAIRAINVPYRKRKL